jgi:hypothetical protein
LYESGLELDSDSDSSSALPSPSPSPTRVDPARYTDRISDYIIYRNNKGSEYRRLFNRLNNVFVLEIKLVFGGINKKRNVERKLKTLK